MPKKQKPEAFSSIFSEGPVSVLSERLLKNPSAPRGRRAGAVETGVLGAGAAELLQPSLQCLPGAVEAHRRVVGADALLLGHLAHAPAPQLDLLQKIRVLGLEGGDKLSHAGAYHP